MTRTPGLPTWFNLFGSQDGREADPGRSVYSPAAYLADLLQLLGDRFPGSDFGQRRPDIEHIVLNGEESYTRLRQLDLVNRVLSARIEGQVSSSAVDGLASTDRPWNLPFEFEHARVEELLRLLRTSSSELHRSFSASPDPDVIARQTLGLSPKRAEVVVTELAGDPARLAAAYGLAEGEGLDALRPVSRFVRATGLSAVELSDLLYARLSPLTTTAGMERMAAGQLFIHRDLGGYVTLDPSETRLVWVSQGGGQAAIRRDGDSEAPTAPIPAAWFDRVNRLVRLARWTGLHLVELDLSLRLVCDGRLDRAALRRLAVLVQLRADTKADVELLCCLVSELDGEGALGAGDDPKKAASLFDRVFNGRRAALSHRYVPSNAAYPVAAYADWSALRCEGALLLEDNRELRERIRQALGLSARDLESVVTRFVEHAQEMSSISEVGMGTPRGLSVLHRVAKLAELTELSPVELLSLLLVLERDPKLRVLNGFGILDHEPPSTSDLLSLLEEGPVSARLWLVQTTLAVAAWARAAGMEPEDLVRATHNAAPEDAAAQLLETARALYEGFLPSALNAEALVSDAVDERTARVTMAMLKDATPALVAPEERRLLRWEPNAARALAHNVVRTLDRVRAEDLEALSLGEGHAGYLRSLLMRRGVLDPQGLLQMSELPATPQGLSIELPDDGVFDRIFEFLHELYQRELTRLPSPADVELHLFPEDLQSLGLSPAEAEEWSERLRFLGMLDETGAVRESDAFADKSDRALFETVVGFDAVIGQALHGFLTARAARWSQSLLRLPADLWEGLSIGELEQQALIENLTFNRYLDDQGAVADVDGLLELTPATFDVALAFHRRRHGILERLQALSRAHRERLLSVSEEDLRPLVDRFAALDIHRVLSEAYLDRDRRLGPVLLEQLAQSSVPEGFAVGYAPAQDARIWEALRTQTSAARRFCLTPEALSGIGLGEAAALDVMGFLHAEGCLHPDGHLVEAEVERFANLQTEQGFVIPGYLDYSRDVFLLLHDAALAVQTTVEGLVTSLSAVAEAQEAAILEALSGRFELSPEATRALLVPIVGEPASLGRSLVAPVLAAVGPEQRIDTAPVDRGFALSLARAEAFAHFARKLRMGARQIELAFQDQQLADKFPEPLRLPDGVDGIDALWAAPDGHVLLFRGPAYWVFAADSLEPVKRQVPLSELGAVFAGVAAIDAIYTLPSGDHWALAGGKAFQRAAGRTTWVERPRPFGRVHNRFEQAATVQAALRDADGRLLLFSGDQYIRYGRGPVDFVDEGYPKTLASGWAEELGLGALPEGWESGIDAALCRPDDRTLLFKDELFVDASMPADPQPIRAVWGQVRHALASATRVDAVVDLDGRCGVVVGDQLCRFSSQLENDGLTMDEGYPRTLASVYGNPPEGFAYGLDAALRDQDGTLHLFRDDTCASLRAGVWETAETRARWGRVRNQLRETGLVDAALMGLDGRLCLFSGDQYVRYSSADLSRVDEGFPRSISGDWAGLGRVDAAFVLDNRTYVFGDIEGAACYLCYSSSDYTKLDEGFPKRVDDNFWNLPQALIEAGFTRPDAVFVAPDGRVHLFGGDRTVAFDHNHRWWSEPRPIAEAWDSLPFSGVSAAFTGFDGRSYLFSLRSDDGAPRFVRYSDPSFQRIDDRFPKPVAEHFGKLHNQLERTGRVDAAVSLMSATTDREGAVVPGPRVRRRYLFSGDQFYRYSSDDQMYVDEGYPRRIATALRDEPAFAHLEAPAERGVDGVWADEGSVYVFIGERVHVASTDRVRERTTPLRPGARAADVEEGRLSVLTAAGWQAIEPPEALSRYQQPGKPRVLRGAPERFQAGLSAILRGVDHNVYLFGAGACYDSALEREYPIGAAWARVRCRIAEDQRIDAALMGPDGKLYLFRRDEYLCYTLAAETQKVIPALADAAPAPIAARFAGLRDVRHAFVRDGMTYLLEAPRADGRFRYVTYREGEFEIPERVAPMEGDFDFWGIPQRYIADGFDRVDAVLVEERDLFLIRDDQFLHYEAATDTWTHPRPLSLRWPGLAWRHPDFEGIHAVVSAVDGQSYFFSAGSWLAHDGQRSSGPTPIAERWGRIDNRIASEQRVDATLVLGGRTYLFAGDQYVRYSGEGYQYVDAGYPRPIAGRLRQETPFAALPEDLELSFEALSPGDVWVEAAVASGPNSVLTIAGRTFVLSDQVSRSHSLHRLCAMRNTLQARGRVDAAFAHAGALYLLSDDQYVRYSEPDLSLVDDGYPRSIATGLLSEFSADPPALPEAFAYAIDAAFVDDAGALLLFKGEQFLRYTAGQAGPLVSAPISGTFGRVQNVFTERAAAGDTRVDAAFVGLDGALYVFRDGHYLRYTDPTAEYVDEGFPKAMRDQFGDLAPDFEAGIDGAFVFDGRTYLARGQRYVRYSGRGFGRVDPIYPQRFAARFCDANDYLLGDLRAIERFVSLDRAHASDAGSLTDFLLAGPRDKATPYALLSGLFDWDVEALKWLKRRDGFLARPERELAGETRFDLELFLRIHGTFALCDRLGCHPQTLYEQVWMPLYAMPKAPTKAGDTLRHMLGLLYPGADWAVIERQLGDALSALLRDAQVAFLVEREGLRDARELSDVLLTDVEIEPCIEGSAVTEAIAAVQLYVQRYLNNLEEIPGADDDNRRVLFKQRFRWLKNYRVWEANRKVFLYPENYLRPELRDTRTRAFRALQDELHQGEIDNATVTQAYKKYLDHYAQVSSLAIAGGYVQPDPHGLGDRELTLFGATRSEPRRYYYRTASFSAPEDGAATTASWGEWCEVGIDIASERVYPVRAFGRMFVFWSELEQRQPEGQSRSLTTTKDGNSETVSARDPVEYRIAIKYSYYDLSEEWAPPQTLAHGPSEKSSIVGHRLAVSTLNDDARGDRIVVDFQYGFADRADTRQGAYRLAADFSHDTEQPRTSADTRATMLSTILHGAETATPNDVVLLGAAAGTLSAPWYSFDLQAKSGSFLARPLPPERSAANVTLQPLAGNREGLPAWQRVDAALEAPDGRRYLFDSGRGVYTELGDLTEHPIAARWGLRHTTVHERGRVDAAWKRRGAWYLWSGDRYLRYSNGLEWADADGDRGATAEERNADGVPAWGTLDAAFTDHFGTTLFFSGDKFVAVRPTGGAGAFGVEQPIADVWGWERNEFSVPRSDGRPAVLGAFTHADRTYLVGPDSFIVYGAPIERCGAPQPQNLKAVLEALGQTDLPEALALPISELVDTGDEILFAAGGDVYVFANGNVSKTRRKAEALQNQLVTFARGKDTFKLTRMAQGVVLELNGDRARPVRAEVQTACLGADGALYLFGRERYVRVAPKALTPRGITEALSTLDESGTAIAEHFGHVSNRFSEPGKARVDAAFERAGVAFLIAGDQYLRYSQRDFKRVDAGYPRPLAGNPDGLPDGAIDAVVELDDGHVCYFSGESHSLSGSLALVRPNRERWGRIRSNAFVRGIDAAFKVGDKHYLLSGSELFSYTAGAGEPLPAYIDGPPTQLAPGQFGDMRGVIHHDGYVYLVGRESYVCCRADNPELPLPGYPRRGQIADLIMDLRARFSRGGTAYYDWLVQGRTVTALWQEDARVRFELSDYGLAGYGLTLDLATGSLWWDWGAWWGWGQNYWRRPSGDLHVDLPSGRYTFRGDEFVRSPAGEEPNWSDTAAVDKVASIWGGSLLSAAVSFGGRTYLFADDRYASLPQAGTDWSDGAHAATTIETALARASLIRGGLTNLPDALMSGVDAAVYADGTLYFFKDDQFARFEDGAHPYEVSSLEYEIIRLTTSTTAVLSERFFAHGVPGLLTLATQQVDERPGFSTEGSAPDTVGVNGARVVEQLLPRDTQLDFESANGPYLWEIFFHIPWFIADSLRKAQRFEDAKGWYEYIFDPTEPVDVWKFLPFLTEDVERIAVQLRDRLQDLVDAYAPAALPDNARVLHDELATAEPLLLSLDYAFQGERELTTDEGGKLGELSRHFKEQRIPLQTLRADPVAGVRTAAEQLDEVVAIVAALKDRWESLQTAPQQIRSYLDDPFDPHAIARLRPIAYRKGLVMAYIGNLLDWGDWLFSQYTRESIGEARALYGEAWDLLGRRSESFGRRLLPPDRAYNGLRDARATEYDLLLQLEDHRTQSALLSFSGTALPMGNASLSEPYFYIPPNDGLDGYWVRTFDRLYKIRHGLNLDGVKQPLPLFAPPIDPMALVQAVAGGGSLANLAAMATPADVPHYRFSFLLGKAQALAQQVSELGGELLSALEKRDSEALVELQTRQEAVVLQLTRDVYKARLEEARTNLTSLTESKRNAQKRFDIYTKLVDAGMIPGEQAQIGLMSAAIALYGVSAGLQLAAAGLSLVPKTLVGLFITGVQVPDGKEAVEKAGDGLQTIAEAIQVGGELAGIVAQFERSKQDWQLQRDLAQIDIKQIEAQIEGGKWQILAAQGELASSERQIAHNAEIARFYRSKFTSQELYDWMAGRLATLHRQTYTLAMDMAKAAERAFQFERGQAESELSFIGGQAWSAPQKGLLSGTQLGLDLSRMEAAYIAKDARRFEIAKKISLAELDPLSFLRLKSEGRCEFELTEALFDQDFPGHYCRQIKTVAVDLDFGEGVLVNATLTQLTHRTVIAPDLKAVQYLLDPMDSPPASLRQDWKAMQQIALSQHDEYDQNNGLFELRFDSEKYLPFEGTGAVCRFRLELSGRPGAYDLDKLTAVNINLKYTALQGGEAFAAGVRGALKPTEAWRSFNLAVDFAEAWQAFMGGDSDVLELPFTRDRLPGMASGAISAMLAFYGGQRDLGTRLSLDMGEQVALPHQRMVDTSGLSIRTTGTTVRLRLRGDRAALGQVFLALRYKAGAA